MFVNKSGRIEHSVYRTFHWCFLPSFGSFDQAVSEENNFQKSTSQKPELHVTAMFVNGSELNDHFLQRTSHRRFLLSFDSFGQANSEEKNFQKSTNQKQEWPVADMFENGSEQNDLPIYIGRSIDASYQFQVYLVMRFQRKISLRNQPIRNKNCLWWLCLLTNRDEMSNFTEDFPQMIPTNFYLFGQAVSEEKICFIRPIRNKNWLWYPCLLTDRDEMSNLYRGPSIDASYQVSVHLAR